MNKIRYLCAIFFFVTGTYYGITHGAFNLDTFFPTNDKAGQDAFTICLVLTAVYFIPRKS